MKKPGLDLLTGVAFIVLLLVIRVATHDDQCSAFEPHEWDESEFETIEIKFSTVEELKSQLATHPQLLKQFNKPSQATDTTAAPCNKGVYPENETCNIEYDGRCFFFRPSLMGSEDVGYTTANTTCEEEGAQLGNIYDDCHYNVTVEFLKRNVSTATVWTGMTVTPQRHVIWKNGTTSPRWYTARWYTEQKNFTKLGISLKSPVLPQNDGLESFPDDRKLNGCFCEITD